MSDTFLPKVSDTAIALVKSGVIVISIHISRDGYEMWGRVTQPHPRLGISTHQSFPVEELTEKLQKVRLQGDLVPLRASSSSSAGGVGLTEPMKGLSLEDAKSMNSGKKLEIAKIGGVVNFLAPDSLTYHDLKKTPKELMARTLLVAEKIGSAKLTSRIATDHDLFMEGHETLFEWWDNATASQRWRLLTTARKVGSVALCKPKTPDEMIARMGYLPCPFRDTEESPSETNSQEGDVQEDSWRIFED